MRLITRPPSANAPYQTTDNAGVYAPSAPEWPQTSNQKILAHARQLSVSEAEDFLIDVAKRGDFKDTETLVDLAQAVARSGHPGAAVHLYGRVLAEQFPISDPLRFHIGFAQAAQAGGMPERALQEYHAALRARPDQKEIHIKIAELASYLAASFTSATSDTYIAMARDSFTRARKDASTPEEIQRLEESIERTHTTAGRKLIWPDIIDRRGHWWALAHYASARGDWDNAELHLKRVLELETEVDKTWHIHNALASLHWKRALQAQSRPQYESALQNANQELDNALTIQPLNDQLLRQKQILKRRAACAKVWT